MRALIVGLFGLALSGCSGAPTSASPTAGPSTQAASTADASGSLSPSVAPSSTTLPISSPAPSNGVGPGGLDILPPGAAIQVSVKELNLREGPAASTRRVKTLSRGTILVTSPIDSRMYGWGPTKRGGYTWYPVVVANAIGGNQSLPALPASPLDFQHGEPVYGWIAANDGSRPFVSPLPPRCPTTVDLMNLQGMLPAERIACFGQPFVLQGTFGCNGCGGISAGTFTPKWLADPGEFDLISADVTVQFGPLALHFPPKGPAKPAAGSIIKATVHVSDSRSSRCSLILEFGEAQQVDARTAVYWCRERLVVDSYAVLGSDPNF
jgi:hypothetical protein